MQAVLDVVVYLVLTVYYVLESLVMAIIPKSYRYKNIDGEIVLITGGGSGIGRLLAIGFAKLGAKVIVWDINEKGAEETVAQVKQNGREAFSYKCDISNKEDVYSVARRVKDEVGKVTILINNAGIVSGKGFLDTPDHLIQKTFDVNIMAHFWTTKAFLPDMIMNDHGHIVTIASLAGLVGVNKLVDYSASKFAAVGFDESLRLELEVEGRRGVKTTVVCPYYINTGMFEGVKSKLFPILEPKYVTDEIISSIRANDKYLIIPGYFKWFLALKLLVPWDASYLFLKRLIADTMLEFGFGGKMGQMETAPEVLRPTKFSSPDPALVDSLSYSHISNGSFTNGAERKL